jgi:formate dehydrogenase subunit gamma
MTSRFQAFRASLATLALVAAVAASAPAPAQHGQDRNPITQPNSTNPTANSVREEDLLNRLQKLEGRVTIPDGKAAILQQPQGRDYRQFREGALPWIGGIAILGMLVALALFYFSKGRIKLEDSPESGRKITRFTALERFTHWLTATAFIVLAITGLNYIFGKRLLLPLLGPETFSTWSQYAKFAHNFISWVFILGVLIMVVVWIRDNVPDRYDWAWLKAGGGFFGRGHPPARRFNAGQKIIYWSVILGGTALSVTGVIMLFPFSAADINGMQWAQYIHATVGVLLIAVMIAHIYIGSLGMEGAYNAMSTGEVDLAWARTHHRIWVEEEQARNAKGPQLGGRAVPAE